MGSVRTRLWDTLSRQAAKPVPRSGGSSSVPTAVPQTAYPWPGGYRRGAYMMTAMPSRQIPAPIRS
jgi:hypothetical protein